MLTLPCCSFPPVSKDSCLADSAEAMSGEIEGDESSIGYITSPGFLNTSKQKLSKADRRQLSQADMTPLQGMKEKDLKEIKKNKRFSLHWFEDDVQDELFPTDEIPHMPEDNQGEKFMEMPTMNTQNMYAGAIGHDEVAHGPLEFVESHRFQMFVAAVIVANAIIIGLETDLETKEEKKIWFWVEQVLLVFFVFEISCRLLHNGPRFFAADARMGNLVDVAIVMSGVIDMWLVPCITMAMRFLTLSKQEHTRNPILQAMSILRMLRIIRLVRLVKIVQPLYRLATGVMEAMQGMFWVLVFLFMLLYAVAIVCTRLIGQGAVLSEQQDVNESKHIDDIEEIKDMFHTVFSSMFVLFELMSCWSLIPLTPLFEIMPIMRLLFVSFYIFSAWALLAVMTGVVSEKMIAVREQVVSEEKASHKISVDATLLKKKFQWADADASSELNREEFETLLGDAETMRQFMLHGNVTPQDLQDLFSWLDADKDDIISVKEFIDGVKWLNDPVTPKSFVQLQEKLSTDLRYLEKKLVTFVNERFDLLINAVKQPLRKISAVTTQVQRLDATCNEMSQLFRDRGRVRLTREGLAEAERRLSGRIDALGDAVETLAQLQASGLVKLAPQRSAPAAEMVVKSSTDFCL